MNSCSHYVPHAKGVAIFKKINADLRKKLNRPAKMENPRIQNSPARAIAIPKKFPTTLQIYEGKLFVLTTRPSGEYLFTVQAFRKQR